MGLPDAASHMIWFVAVVGLAGLVLDTAFDTAAELAEARDARETIDRERVFTFFGNSTYCHAASTLAVRAVNEGRTTLNASAVTLVVDGVVTTGFTKAPGTSTLWLPNETVWFNKSSVSAAPARVALFTERGVMKHLQQVTCTVDVHVDDISTYLNNVAASSFAKGRDTVETRVTIRDSAGALVQGATVTIQLRDSDGTLAYTGSATTSASGIASISYAIPSGSKHGQWTDRVTAVAGSGVVYDSASNVETQITFTVTPN